MIIYNIGNNRRLRLEVAVDDTRRELIAIIDPIDGRGPSDRLVVPLGQVQGHGCMVGAAALADLGLAVVRMALGRRPLPRGQA